MAVGDNDEFKEFVIIALSNKYFLHRLNYMVSYLESIDFVSMINVINVRVVNTLITEIENFIHKINHIKGKGLGHQKLKLIRISILLRKIRKNKRLLTSREKLDKPKNLFLTLPTFLTQLEPTLDFTDDESVNYLKASKDFLANIQKVIVGYTKYQEISKPTYGGLGKSMLKKYFKKMKILHLILDQEVRDLNISKPSYIKELEIEGSSFSFNLKSNLINLEKLRIENCVNLNLVTCRYNLVELLLLQDCNINQFNTALFNKLKNLTLVGINITESNLLDIVSRNPNLENLHLENMNIGGKGNELSHDFMTIIPNLTKLKELTIKNSVVAEAYKLVSMELPKSTHTFVLEGVNFSDLNAVAIKEFCDKNFHVQIFIDRGIGDSTV
jgi:hypothetical protein